MHWFDLQQASTKELQLPKAAAQGQLTELQELLQHGADAAQVDAEVPCRSLHDMTCGC